MTQMWWTSDQHFGHANIIRYCNRPFASVEEMDRELIRRWNTVVKPNDTTMVVGDFSFHKETQTAEILAQLHGEKVLVLGNHDRRKSHTYWYRVGFSEVCSVYHQWVEPFGLVLVKHIPTPYSAVWAVQVNGHVHDKWKRKCYGPNGKVTVNVGVDQWNFTPISTQELVTFLRKDEC